MTSSPYTPDEAELIGCYAGAMEEQAGENYATAKADAERGIAKIKADAALTAVEKVLEVLDGWEPPDPCNLEIDPCLDCLMINEMRRAIEGASDE